ncbi:hypothetical protein H6G80_28390 [Nostoc sp. FACHB-87]|uniref:hypothetical protein n=1 Tax=Nostocaceae TaxID=1162 RepID=UPI001688DD02|nr:MULTISPECIES: hypothetical protein [Nostocaceae]MBD2457971.1 hypothetical protein [Nostoc sp. FACHB-87]MBD2479252.1 hypothetical protein [Anabaena sp. FACHB-83]
MTLYSKLAEVEAKVGQIETKLGLPQRKNLLVRQIVNNHIAKTSVITDHLITPKPYITNVAPRLVNLQVASEGVDQVFIAASDTQVEIPRTYPKNFFLTVGSLKTIYMIDPPLTSGGAISYINPTTKTINGYFHNLIYLSDNDPTRWLLVLRQETDKR